MVQLKNISKSFDGVKVLNNFSLNIQSGRFYTVIGPNGCGKTTLLNIIAGTIEKDNGEIIHETCDMKTAYVWQDYRSSLFPWLSITDNISFPLMIQGLTSKERKNAVNNLIEEFNIKINLKEKIYNLSGGQQQLVNIMRALIIEPALFILDEPFSALDQYKSWQMGFELERLWLNQKSSVLYVSHDIDEAILLADEIILLNNYGVIEETLKNNMPRRRTKEMMSEKEHLELKREIVNFLFEQQN